MLLALNSLAAEQNNATDKTMDRVVWLLNYAASHPDTAVVFHASDMYLHVHSDASYLSEPFSKSRYAGFFYLTRKPLDPNVAPTPGASPPPLNGPILVVTHRLKETVASAAEAKLGGLFHISNRQRTVKRGVIKSSRCSMPIRKGVNNWYQLTAKTRKEKDYD